jgi:anhydro-N-acetylmuramic acid kinase
MTNAPIYIGIMSGTSLDAVDIVAVRFTPHLELITSKSISFPEQLRQDLISLTQPGDNEIDRLGVTDNELGAFYANVVCDLISENKFDKNNIDAIGCHGQTVRHRPDFKRAFTLQIGDPSIIAFKTGIMTVADFRRKDMAAGGQGAPLVPAFHHAVFSSTAHDRLIINIGGMSNITALSRNGNVTGFDTGPGNILLDAWINTHHEKDFDENGMWASQGQINNALLNALLQEPYFKMPPPKSTGRELFNLHWLEEKINTLSTEISPQDVQATLVELTAISISEAVQKHFNAFNEIYICGGGAYNTFLMQRLEFLLHPRIVASTQSLGMDPRWVEATAFAWLAKQTMERKPGNLPSVTGATSPVILGAVYYA